MLACERPVEVEAAVGGTGRMLESSLCSTKRIRTDNEVLVRIERAARPDHMVEQVVVHGKTMLEQDSVVLCGIERAVSDVGHLQVLYHAAAFECEFTKVCDLVRWLIRPVSVDHR